MINSCFNSPRGFSDQSRKVGEQTIQGIGRVEDPESEWSVTILARMWIV